MIREAAVAGYHEFRVFFTLRMWLGGWVVRLFFQVLFFALVGVYVAQAQRTSFILVGNALAVIALEGAVVAHAAAFERNQGTLAGLIVSPGNHVVSLFSRNLIRIPLGVASSTIVMVSVLGVMRIQFPWARIPWIALILVVVSYSCYGYGWFFGALVYKFRKFQQASTNIAYLGVTVICGVNVPTSYWPVPVQKLAQILPLTHGLLAVRGIVGQVPSVNIPLEILTEGVIGSCWLVVAGCLLHAFVEADRANGRLELA
ncbi:ABC transporter permease [Streptomyces sp. NPDC007856]|uniref:ABC transporter permease n=1 Tax=Streptomyces sp. NPDC007856 TaxID=3364781 RepID=UPI003697E758